MDKIKVVCLREICSDGTEQYRVERLVEEDILSELDCCFK